MSAHPACSLIVTCRNPGARLGPTLASALEQRRATVEVIVVERPPPTEAWLAVADRLQRAAAERPADGGGHAGGGSRA